MRITTLQRKTNETDIKLTINLDGSGQAKINTGCGFFDHMLELFAHHSGFDLEISCVGDTHVDDHHTVEDVAIVLGKAVDALLGDRRGIARYGSIFIAMDEALALTAVDIGGRSTLNFDLPIPAAKIGDFDSELVKEFFAAFARALPCSLHIKGFCGENSHHIAEAAFKAFARAMKSAVALEGDPDKIPSSKGSLS